MNGYGILRGAAKTLMSLLPPAAGLDQQTANSVRSGDDGRLGEVAQHEPVAVIPVQLGGGDGEAEFGEAAQQRPESDLALGVYQSGWRNRATTLLPMRLVVVSCPATISWKIVEFSSWVPRRSSASRALISPLTRSSAGPAYLASTSSASIAHDRIGRVLGQCVVSGLKMGTSSPAGPGPATPGPARARRVARR